MISSFFSAFIWHVKRMPTQLGMLGSIGVGLLAFGLVFYLSTIVPQQEHIANLRREATLLQMNPRVPKLTANKNPTEQLATFYKFLPPTNTAPDWLSKLYDSARANNLFLEQGSYRLTSDQDGKVIRYEILLPVKASYQQTKKFLAQTLIDIPSLSLDSVTYQRQKIGDTMIESQIRLTLFLGESA